MACFGTVISISSMNDDEFRRFDAGANGSKMRPAVHCCLSVNFYNECCHA
jgi:hypothetical protein